MKAMPYAYGITKLMWDGVYLRHTFFKLYKKNTCLYASAKIIKYICIMKKKPITNLDAIKAMRRGNREAEMQLLGPGFHCKDRVHRSAKTYTRKQKHKLR